MKRQRKLAQKTFGLNAISSYHPLIASEAESFLHRIFTTPDSYKDHTHRYASGFALSVLYGYEAAPPGDDFLSLAKECIDFLSNGTTSRPGVVSGQSTPSPPYSTCPLGSLASMMVTLDISKAVDKGGNVVEPKVNFNNPIFRRHVFELRVGRRC